MPARALPVAVIAALALAALLAPAAQAFRLPDQLLPLQGNPAHALSHLPPDPVTYDGARRCDPKPKPGVVRLTRWLQANVRGAYWGSYRCEKWGRHEASLHAENRAIDWHLDASSAADRRAASTLIGLLLGPDRVGTPHALARRMGVEEIIWDCSYWGAGMTQFKPYSPCFAKDGTPRRHVGKTVAHRDHIHFGLTKDGAAARTSFWRAR
jgi:hypothetical protein